MTLPERTKALNEKLVRLGDAASNQLFLDRLEAKRSELLQTSAPIQRKATQASFLLRHNHLDPTGLPSAAECVERLRKAKTDLDQDRNAITSQEFAEALNALRRFAQQLEEVVRDTWRELRSRDPRVDDGLLDVAQQVGEGNRVRRIRDLAQDLQNVQAIPSNAKDWQQFENIRRELTEEISALGEANFPPEVVQFFRDAQSNQGANLTLLTTEVKDWLEEKGLLDRLRIRLG